MTTIYIILNKLNGKQYVGQTRNYEARKSGHKSQRNKTAISSAIAKYGWANFEMKPLVEVEDCLADITEKAYIHIFNTLGSNGYNLTKGGQINKAITAATKIKISEALLGIRRTDVTKNKMSKAKTGVAKTDEHKKKLSDANKGKHSETVKSLWANSEYSQKQKLSHAGKISPTRVKVASEDNKIIFDCVKHAKDSGLATIDKYLDTGKEYKGHKWFRLKEEIV